MRPVFEGEALDQTYLVFEDGSFYKRYKDDIDILFNTDYNYKSMLEMYREKEIKSLDEVQDLDKEFLLYCIGNNEDKLKKALGIK